ncbi:hypothetical protein ACTA71_003096 [Dictyostelium dimigraforme]
MVNQRTFFDVEIDGKPIGRIIFELFNDVAPKTTENFRVLCLGTQYSKITQTRLHYKGTPFHRIIKNFMVQCGDFQNKNGTGGESIYGKRFDDENFKIKHSEPYLLSMANAGPNTNGSQFFITTAPAPHLDGKHCVFGKVVSGQNVVDILNALLTDQNDKPYADVKIVHCGELVLKSSSQNKKSEQELDSDDSSSDSDSDSNSDSDLDSDSDSEDDRKKRKKRKKRKEKKRKSKDRKKKKKRSYSSSSDDSDYSNSDDDDNYKKRKKRNGRSRSRSKDRKSSSSSSSSKRDRSRSGSIDDLRDRYKPLSSKGYDKKSTSPIRQSDSSGRIVKGRGAVKYSSRDSRNGGDSGRYGRRDYRDNGGRDYRDNGSRDYRDNGRENDRDSDRYRDRYAENRNRDEKDNDLKYNKRKEGFNDNVQLDSSRSSSRSYADIDYKDTYSEKDLENIKITIKNDNSLDKENERKYSNNNNNNEKEEGEHEEENLKRKEETTSPTITTTTSNANSSNVVSSPLSSSSVSKNEEKNINPSSPVRKNRDESDDDRRGRRRRYRDDDDDYSDD